MTLTFDEQELSILRSIILNAKGIQNWPIAWDNEKVKAVVEKITPTTYSTVDGYGWGV